MFPEELETERLRLRRLSRETIDPLELYRYTRAGSGFDEVATHLTTDPHQTPNDAREYLLESEEGWDDATRANWAIYPRDGEPRAGEFAGVASLIPLWGKRTAMLGVWLRKPFWGRGYSGERATALIDLAFDRLDLEVVTAGHLEGNENSGRAIEKYVDRFGGQYDGVLRNWIPMDDEVRDLHRYTITAEQWAESRSNDAVNEDRGSEHRGDDEDERR